MTPLSASPRPQVNKSRTRRRRITMICGGLTAGLRRCAECSTLQHGDGHVRRCKRGLACRAWSKVKGGTKVAPAGLRWSWHDYGMMSDGGLTAGSMATGALELSQRWSARDLSCLGSCVLTDCWAARSRHGAGSTLTGELKEHRTFERGKLLHAVFTAARAGSVPVQPARRQGHAVPSARAPCSLRKTGLRSH